MRFFVSALTLSLTALAGCSGSPAPVVRGRLLDHGRPLTVDNPDEFDLKLVSVGGPGPGRNVFAARVERDGVFVFAGPTGRGVPVGAYKVVIETGPVPDSFGRAGDRFHKGFTEPNTPLVLNVTPETDEVSIDVGSRVVGPPVVD